MTSTIPVPAILRHKAAIRRGELSLTFKCLQRDRLLTLTGTVFDYGCGHGEDVTRLRALGMNCDGWDPMWRPDGRKQPADVVNLGYVLNVIENVNERTDGRATGGLESLSKDSGGRGADRGRRVGKG